MDVAADRLFVSNSGTGAIYVYDNASTLNLEAAPDRIIA